MLFSYVFYGHAGTDKDFYMTRYMTILYKGMTSIPAVTMLWRAWWSQPTRLLKST